MNYEIVKDETALKEFISWLPELKDDEIFYVCLFARKKYSPELKQSAKTDKSQLKRFTSKKDHLFNKLKQLECPLGSYTFKDTIAPQESLAVYISVNPRNMRTATKNSLIKLADLVTRNYNGWNVHQEVISEIQKAKSETRFVDFDFDVPETSNTEFCGVNVNKKTVHDVLLLTLPQFVNWNAVNIIETRGGFHVLVQPDKVEDKYRKTWYLNIKGIAVGDCVVDQAGDIMLPVVGCTQGNFIPKFIL